VFTARYALSPYIKQIRFVLKGLTYHCSTIRDVHSGRKTVQCECIHHRTGLPHKVRWFLNPIITLFVATYGNSDGLLTFYVLRKVHENEAVFFVEGLKRAAFVNTIKFFFYKSVSSHAWQHATTCVHATDPLGSRIQWAARVITRNELMNKKRVISIALSVAVNCMTQTSTGFKITLKVFHMCCKTYH
jgi:hypothetical protein